MTATPEFVISRLFDAPRALVWKAWTTPELMAQWWGPKGFTMGQYAMDMRPGGIYHYCIRSPEGFEMWGKFVYREVTDQQKLVFVNCFSDAKGGITRHPMSPLWPLELLSAITFEDDGGKTKVTIRWSPLDASDEEIKTFADGMASMERGWGGTLDQLASWLAAH